MKASILFVGHPTPQDVQFGADFSPDYDSADVTLAKTSYAVVAVADKIKSSGTEAIRTSYELLKKIRLSRPNTQTILVSAEPNPAALQQLINEAGLFKIIANFEPHDLQLAVREALEEYELIKQNEAFLQLRTDQNKKLQELSAILEDRVQAREKYLMESREILMHSTRRLEALNRALVAAQRSTNREEMEKLLNDALKGALQLAWTRILFSNHTYLDKIANSQTAIDMNIFSSPLFKNKELLGHIYFARSKNKPFSADEDDFLLQVGDAVGLTIDRLLALEEIEDLKQEWDSTFDAITDAVSVITPEYKIVRANRAFAEKAQSTVENIVGKTCYEALFGSSSPCSECRLGEAFSLGQKEARDHVPAHFSVNSQAITLEDGQRAFAVFYRDTSAQEKIQRQILESSKMAEIGTIGSSIAHEINNPLGGILAFVQIIKSELKEEDKIYADIIAMEEAALRSKNIVENLLAFTRSTTDASEFTETRLGDLIRLVTNIIELQTKGLGINFIKRLSDQDIKIKGNTNQLVQVLVNVLQNSCEALAERLSQGQRIPAPEILLITRPSAQNGKMLEIEITDNGPGISTALLSKVFTPFFTTKDKSKNPGLGLSVSYQIVKEHLGFMEISSLPGQSTTISIQLPMA